MRFFGRVAIRAGWLGFGRQGSRPNKTVHMGYIEPMRSALTAANRILQHAGEQGMSLTPLQLMKLTYMSHGWALGILGRPLFNDRVEAWKYGPVIPTLYHKTKEYGSSARLRS